MGITFGVEWGRGLRVSYADGSLFHPLHNWSLLWRGLVLPGQGRVADGEVGIQRLDKGGGGAAG